MMSRKREIELLAPARNAEIARQAILAGADALYIGATSHGARSQAANSVAEISEVVDLAHQYGVRVYVTINTIIYDNEIGDVQDLIWRLYEVGVDALIVQDLALLKMEIPPIALHASTQCDIRTPEKARFMEACGFSQLVLPRELSLTEIREISEKTSVPLEAFVHGALCVSYSGDCQASYALTGRSANRGECAQVCRFKFDLEDGEGHKLLRGKHLLSLRDMCRISHLKEMLEAGISSFKIEGRLKNESYVTTVVAAYRNAIDDIIKQNPDKWERASWGVTQSDIEPNLNKSFNRGYTPYFLCQKPQKMDLVTFDSPKSIGEIVGTVTRVLSPRKILVKKTQEIVNGDGLGFMGPSGDFEGFRVNKVEGDAIKAASALSVDVGTKLYRTFDKQWEDKVSANKLTRKVPLAITLRRADNLIVAEAVVAGKTIATSVCHELEIAKTPQSEARERIMGKLGDTNYSLSDYIDQVGDNFIPASVLTTLRRDLISAVNHTIASTHKYECRKPMSQDLKATFDEAFKTISRHDNISNQLSAEFYKELSGIAIDKLPKAIECAESTEISVGERIMQTRYCLRREMGACLKTKECGKLPKDLYLTSGGNRMKLEFDCANCRMNVLLDKPKGRKRD